MDLQLSTYRAGPKAPILALAELRVQRSQTGSRRPVHLCLLVDRSSSMDGPRLKRAIDATKEVLQRLGTEDRFSLVLFDARAELICSARPVSEELREALVTRLQDMTPGTGTNIGAALQGGAQVVHKTYLRDGSSGLVLLTDGQATTGITDHARLCAIGKALRRAEVSVSALGLGSDFDDELLLALAEESGGSYSYLAGNADIAPAFNRIAEGLFTISARAAELRFIPSGAVKSSDLLHRLPCSTGHNGMEVELGDLGHFDTRRVLFRIETAPDFSSGNLGTMRISYRTSDGEPRMDHVLGLTYAPGAQDEVSQALAEDLRLRVAKAADAAWAKRKRGGQELLRLRELHHEISVHHSEKRLDLPTLTSLSEELHLAEQAIATSAQNEDARRRARERSQLIKMGILAATRADE